MASGLAAHFRMLARYNRLANERLYASCAELDDAARRQDRGAFFRSIHGTLNHIMVGDRIWMARFEGGIVASTGLDAILHDDFDELRAALRPTCGRDARAPRDIACVTLRKWRDQFRLRSLECGAPLHCHSPPQEAP